ncbi:RNA polymerase sigma factor [Streptomyces puniciscabiei]|uniref:RNA polymerase sigma factor n=1 Tax=Streptomyces puniciscabiei TaxID=164348 RepID=UPI0033238E85
MTDSAASSGPFRRKREVPKLFQGRVARSEITQEEVSDAILQLLDSRRSYWLAIIRRFVPDRYAEDVLQQGSIKIYQSLERTDARDIRDPNGWIARVCINCALDERRRMDTEAKALRRHGLEPETWHDPEVVEAAAGYLAIREVMDEVLTERQHEIYVLRHVAKFNSPEIAAMLEIKSTSVRKDLSLAQKILNKPEVRERLRSRLHDEG